MRTLGNIVNARSVLGGIVMVTTLCHAAGTGQISGTVHDPTGAPVAGAAVAVLARFPVSSAIPFTRFDAEVTTDNNGKFTVTGVPAGKFAVCPRAADLTLLPPCVWEAEPTVTLTAGQSLTMPAIQLKKGADLYVRVNDPNGTRAVLEGKIAGASLLLGVRSPNGMLVIIPQTAADATGTDNHLTVPVTVNLTAVAFSQTYTMTDGNNAAIDKQMGLAQPVSISANQPQFSLVINIK